MSSLITTARINAYTVEVSVHFEHYRPTRPIEPLQLLGSEQYALKLIYPKGVDVPEKTILDVLNRLGFERAPSKLSLINSPVGDYGRVQRLLWRRW